MTDSDWPSGGSPHDLARTHRLASPLLVECAHGGITPRVELQGSRRTTLEHSKTHSKRREQRGLSTAVLGEQDGRVFFEREPQLFETTVGIDADLAKLESAHVTLLGGASGESYRRPLAAAAASAS